LAGILIDEEKVQRLTDQIVNLVKLKNLDGVNVDFEFESGSSEISQEEFTNFMKVLSVKLKKLNNKAILSADFYADAEINDYPYGFEELNEYLDQFLVMTYDYHRRASENAGPVSPLKWTNPDFDYDVQRTIEYYLSFIPAEKLLMGIPFYGYSWQTQTEDFNSESLWGSGKTVLYKDIENLIAETGSEIFFDPESATCWIVYIDEEGNINQVYFDNPYSLGKKADFLRGKKLAGAFIWALGYEGDQVQLWNVFMK
jgi:spore germination protein YaaH